MLQTDPDWRDLAINDTLRANGNEGTFTLHTLLHHIRTHRPQGSTLRLGPMETRQLLRFLEERATGVRRLLTGTDDQIHQGAIEPYIGWYAITWEGAEIEVVMPFGVRHYGPILYSEDREVLHHCGVALEAYSWRPSGRSLSYFDRVFHIGLPAHTERRAYCLRLLSRSTLTERMTTDLDRDALAEQAADRTDGFTPAYLKEAFVAAALHLAQESTVTLGQRFAENVLSQIEELRRHLQMLKDPDALGDFVNPDAAPVGIRRRT